ncbi:unnamed protein product [Prorocentrum cordatum]|uniref:Strictosidine synthase conserved region domain-containing protein n=1 Tax=Prorocentrum cordatum TaxID=2364126 RepID=A0ABN9VYJ0_9DINO|nr:unnamed protein product [Polarella glacialis]
MCMAFSLLLHSALAGAEHIGLGELLRPESMAPSPRGDALYLTMGDGSIVRLWHGRGGDPDAAAWETVARTGEALEGCGVGGPAGEKRAPELRCGRPLGVRAVRRGTVDPLAAQGDEDRRARCVRRLQRPADGFAARRAPGKSRGSGETGTWRLGGFPPPERPGPGPRRQHLSSVPSTGFQRREIVYALLSGRPDGRLLRYSNGTVEVVMTGIFMANGITLTHDGKGLLVAMGIMRIARFDFATRELTAFADLPGSVDNIRTMDTLPNGTARRCYWLGLGSRAAKPFSFLHFAAPLPQLRAAIAALVPYEMIVRLIPKKGILAALGEDGALLATYEDPGGRTPWLSEAHTLGGYVYLGSWFNPFLARVSASDLR